jgi:DivIVA domain-containing protein
MELTPEKFEKAEFTERRRGYDIDQVESFLEETGTEFAQMLAKFRHTEQRAAAAEERAAAAESRLSQTDSIVAEATERVQRAERAARAAQQQAAEAQQAAAQGAAAQGAANESAARANEAAEIEQAAKTLLMAQRTADATVTEARGQAQSLLEDARARADRQQAESTAEAEELVRLARLQAEEEYADRRAAVLEEVRSLEARRAQLADVITQLEARLAGYRSELSRTAEEISTLVDDPSRLGARPNMSIPPDEVLPSSGASGAGDVESTDVDDAVEDYLGGLGDTATEPEPTAATPTVPADAPVHDAPSASAAPVEPSGDDGPGGGAASASATDASGDLGADSHYVDLTAPNGSLDRDTEAEGTWGPGSWSQLEADLDVDAAGARPAEVVSAAAAAGSSVRSANGPSTGSTATVRPQPEVRAEDDDYVDDRPTQAVDRADAPRDRYMQELDDAVNDTGTVSTTDDAMTAFFEGTNESKTRRFGWRR